MKVKYIYGDRLNSAILLYRSYKIAQNADAMCHIALKGFVPPVLIGLAWAVPFCVNVEEAKSKRLLSFDDGEIVKERGRKFLVKKMRGFDGLDAPLASESSVFFLECYSLVRENMFPDDRPTAIHIDWRSMFRNTDVESLSPNGAQVIEVAGEQLWFAAESAMQDWRT